MRNFYSVAVWFSDHYEIYAGVIVTLSLFSIAMDLYQIRKQEKKLRSMVHSSAFVQVLRNGENPMKVSSEEVSSDF